MDNENVKKASGFKAIVCIVAAVSLVLALCCFISPMARKKQALSTTGREALGSMRSACMAISYYSAGDIAYLSEKPQMNAQSKQISGLLTQLCGQLGYENIYILGRKADKTMQYLADGSYRDNGKAGTDYFAPGAAYPAEGGYKSVKSTIDKIYSGKSTGGYANEIVTRPDHKSVAVICLPIYGQAHAVAAVLCIEADPGNTEYNMVGGVNLYYIGLILLAVFTASLLVLFMRKKAIAFAERHRAAKEQKALEKAEREAEKAAEKAGRNAEKAEHDANIAERDAMDAAAHAKSAALTDEEAQPESGVLPDDEAIPAEDANEGEVPPADRIDLHQ